MAVFVAETLEGKLTEQLEVSEGLELAARIARARERMNRLEFASDNNESKQAAGTMAGPDEK